MRKYIVSEEERAEARRSRKRAGGILNILGKSKVAEEVTINIRSGVIFVCKHVEFRYNFVITMIQKYIDSRKKGIGGTGAVTGTGTYNSSLDTSIASLRYTPSDLMTYYNSGYQSMVTTNQKFQTANRKFYEHYLKWTKDHGNDAM
jgi:hypothetical protein